MFFFLSKTIGPWLLPSNFLIAIGAFGVVLVYTRHKLLGRRLLIVCVVGLLICGFSPLGNALLMPIEARFSKWKARPEHQIDGIIVLGGGIERIGAAVELAREHPNARVLYTGGEPDLFRSDELAETDIALRFFDEFGISRQRLLLERRARNTLENAEFSKAIAAPKPGEHWLLITSASHMPRAMGVFRTAGFRWKLIRWIGRRGDGPICSDCNAHFRMGSCSRMLARVSGWGSWLIA